ncbi:MAG TPA: zinc-dependent metalloprotease family protein [Bauldia sp.]|nr:zinc-dependent metalloprotease family protein [Bauldia sp.]
MTFLRRAPGFSLPIVLLLSGVALIPGAFAQEPATFDLFAAERPNRAGLPTDASALGLLPGVVGAIDVFSITVDAGSRLRSGGPDSQRLRISLPGGSDVSCEVTRGTPINGVEVIEGTVTESPGDRCALFVKDGAVTGDIAVGSERYRVVPLSGNAHAVVEVRTSGMSEGGNDAPTPPNMPRRSERSLRTEPLCDVAGAGNRGAIDILVLYTPLAAARQDIDVLVAEAMSQLNQAARMHPGDRFGVAFRLAGMEEVDYREGENLGVDLDRLTGLEPGFLTEVPALRDKYRADLVHMIVEGQADDGTCGIGWMVEPDAATTAEAGFSISDHRCTAANLSFAHEIGHNLGMNHDRYVVEESDPDAINFGFVSLEDGRRTLMAYGNQCYDKGVDCPRVVTFSTPDPVLGGDRRWGVALDGPNPAYNREILCRYAPEVTNYR